MNLSRSERRDAKGETARTSRLALSGGGVRALPRSNCEQASGAEGVGSGGAGAGKRTRFVLQEDQQ